MTRGFTLIELLVLIAIIGILVAAVIANMNRAKVQAFNAAALGCAQDIRNQQKIAQTTEKRFVTYDNLPAKTACRPLEALNAAPTGGATELQYAYQTRHPRGTKTYVVTDADIYTDGIGAQGQVLSADPAAPLLTGAPSGPIGGGEVSTTTTLPECLNLSAQNGGSYHHLAGDPDNVMEYTGVINGTVGQTATFTRLAPDVVLREQGSYVALHTAVVMPNSGTALPSYGPAVLENDGRVTINGQTRTPTEWVDFARTEYGGTSDTGDATPVMTGYFTPDMAFPACVPNVEL